MNCHKISVLKEDDFEKLIILLRKQKLNSNTVASLKLKKVDQSAFLSTNQEDRRRSKRRSSQIAFFSNKQGVSRCIPRKEEQKKSLIS